VLHAPRLDPRAERVVWDHVSVVQNSTSLWARRVRREPVFDRGSLVRVPVGADDGVLHGLKCDRADEVIGHRIVHLQGRGLQSRRRAQADREANDARIQNKFYVLQFPTKRKKKS
jgi:hypothetical protein